MVEWSKIKAEYISGGTSYRKLAKKYGVSPTTLTKVAIREGWNDARHQAEIRQTSKIVNDVSNKNAKIDDTYFRCVDKLMRKAEELIDSTPIWQPQIIKEMATTMKYLKDCKGIKSEADMREQEARIERLRKDAQTESQGDTTVTVRFEEDISKWCK